MLIESADGAYETLVKLADDDVGERWLVRASDGGFAFLVRLSEARSSRPSDRTSILLRAIHASKAKSERVRLPIDRGEFEGRPFVVFPYRFDVSLRALVARLQSLGKRLRPEVVVELVASLAEALEELKKGAGADASNLVHGGIRPDRVRIAFATDVELDGFGLAPPPGAASAAPESSFIAPEVRAGTAANASADVYALAAVAWEALAARRFDPSLAREALEGFVPDAPFELSLLLRKALEEDPSDRVATPGSFARALRVAIEEMPTLAPGDLSRLASTAIAPEDARAPFASDPGIAAVLERDRPDAEPALLERLCVQIVPGTPADLVDAKTTRSVFGSRPPNIGLSGVTAPARSLPRPESFAPNPVASSPAPRVSNSRSRSSVPPPSSSRPPAPGALLAASGSVRPAPPSTFPSKPPSANPAWELGARANAAAFKPAVEDDDQTLTTSPGGFGAPAALPPSSSWMKQGAPLPTSSAERASSPTRTSSLPPPPPPPHLVVASVIAISGEAGASAQTRSSSPPAVSSSVAPPIPAAAARASEPSSKPRRGLALFVAIGMLFLVAVALYLRSTSMEEERSATSSEPSTNADEASLAAGSASIEAPAPSTADQAEGAEPDMVFEEPMPDSAASTASRPARRSSAMSATSSQTRELSFRERRALRRAERN